MPTTITDDDIGADSHAGPGDPRDILPEREDTPTTYALLLDWRERMRAWPATRAAIFAKVRRREIRAPRPAPLLVPVPVAGPLASESDSVDPVPARKHAFRPRSTRKARFRGVFREKSGRFWAQINIPGTTPVQTRKLGVHATDIEAALVWDAAAISLGFPIEALNFPERQRAGSAVAS